MTGLLYLNSVALMAKTIAKRCSLFRRKDVADEHASPDCCRNPTDVSRGSWRRLYDVDESVSVYCSKVLAVSRTMPCNTDPDDARCCWLCLNYPQEDAKQSQHSESRPIENLC